MNINVPFLVTSLLKVGPILLEDQTVKFLLTERLTQDAVESYFGDQRNKGHRTTNPNIQQHHCKNFTCQHWIVKEGER